MVVTSRLSILLTKRIWYETFVTAKKKVIMVFLNLKYKYKIVFFLTHFRQDSSANVNKLSSRLADV